MERIRHGHAVLGAFTNDAGATVLTSGSTDWAHGLAGRDPQIEQITRNVLTRLGSPAPHVRGQAGVTSMRTSPLGCMRASSPEASTIVVNRLCTSAGPTTGAPGGARRRRRPGRRRARPHR